MVNQELHKGGGEKNKNKNKLIFAKKTKKLPEPFSR